MHENQAVIVEENEPLFFSVSPFKLIILSLFTFGLYEQFWFYKNWSFIKKRTGDKLMPFWRAVFSPLWAYDYFSRIKSIANKNSLQVSISPGLRALFYFLLIISHRLPDPFWLISFFSFIPLLKANKGAKKINSGLSPNLNNHGKFTIWNWLLLGVGTIFMYLILFGALIQQGQNLS